MPATPNRPCHLRFPRQRVLTGLTAAVLLAACARIPPVPFQLLERDQVHSGIFFPAERRISATIADKHFEGFYIFATGTAYSQGLWPTRRGLPNDMLTTFSTNAAKATMSAADGEKLFCDFVFEGRRAIGECKALDGRHYQLVTQSR